MLLALGFQSASVPSVPIAASRLRVGGVAPLPIVVKAPPKYTVLPLTARALTLPLA